MLNDAVFVWGTLQGGEPAGLPTVSVSAWPHLFDDTWVRSPSDPRLAGAKVAFVNQFHTADSTYVERIKTINPSCYVVVMPDAPLDMILAHAHDWSNIYRQMAFADAIGGRTHADCDVYGALFNKAAFYLPSPIGPTEGFARFRELPKDNYVITLDHTMDRPNVVCNIAALADLQRRTACRVVYCAARDHTPSLAAYAHLNAEFRGYVEFWEFVELTARAKVCVDIYPTHSYGRQAMLCAMVGTPCVTGLSCADAPGVHTDEFLPRNAAREAELLLTDDALWTLRREHGFRTIEQNFSLDACRRRLFRILDDIKKAREHENSLLSSL